MPSTSWLEIDLAQLEANLLAFQRVIELASAKNTGLRRGSGPARIAASVKADAYGLGLVPVAQRLSTKGVDMFAVFSPRQAEDMITVATDRPIIVMMRMDEVTRRDPLYRQAVTGRLQMTIHDREQIKALERTGRMLGIRMPIHLYLDTGMSRGGLAVGELAEVMSDIRGYRNVRLAGVSTHLASAESDGDFTDTQLAAFDDALQPHLDDLPEDVLIHVANTAGALRSASHHRDMIRIGLGLYGYGAESFTDVTPLLREGDIRPVVRWVSSIIHMRDYPAGATVGYGSTHRVSRPSRLGLIPVGYGDGYPLLLSGKASVDLPDCPKGDQPAAAPVLGRVNMDQLVIDLTEIPDAKIGSNVELYSNRPESPCALPRLADLAQSHCYELLCRLSPRLERRHLHHG